MVDELNNQCEYNRDEFKVDINCSNCVYERYSKLVLIAASLCETKRVQIDYIFINRRIIMEAITGVA